MLRKLKAAAQKAPVWLKELEGYQDADYPVTWAVCQVNWSRQHVPKLAWKRCIALKPRA